MLKALVFSVIAIASNAHAGANVSNCISKMQQAAQSCGENNGMLSILTDYGQPDQCTIANSPDGRSQIVVSYSTENAMATMDANNVCKISFAVLPSPVLEAKQMSGRVIMRAADNRLYVVDRAGGISELLNSSRKSLSVADFQIKDDSILIIQPTNNGPFQWDTETLFKKLNGNTRKANLLGLTRQ